MDDKTENDTEAKMENTKKRLGQRRRASKDRQDTSDKMIRERDGAKDKTRGPGTHQHCQQC